MEKMNPTREELAKLNNAFQETYLVHCVTNEITCESLANAILYVNSKPIMADDPREFSELFKTTDSLLLNIGHLSKERENQLLAASHLSQLCHKPTVIDVVGVTASSIRKKLSLTLLNQQPSVVKGNTSEIRMLCGLNSRARGVDGDSRDQQKEAVEELVQALIKKSEQFPQICFLATGAVDIIVMNQQVVLLKNGVPELDKITGTGDIVGALIATLLPQMDSVLLSVIGAVSYFNLCGEKALESCSYPFGMATFRQCLFDELSLLYGEKKNWWEEIKGEKVC